MTANRPPGIADAAMLALIAVAVALVLAVWLWGGVAGALFGSGWPHTSSGELLTVLVRLPARLGDPATAWPRPARSLLPGPSGFYAALGLLAALTASLIAAASRLGVTSAASGRSPGARWAAGGELRALHGGGRAGRLALGRCRGRLLYAEQRHALVAFGPPQSGKSAGLAVPALLEWDGPAVASSIKTDLLACTEARRRTLGRVYVFDPFALSGVEAQTWSPLRGAAT
jgi:type IV secretion system protein VirD4